MEVDVMAKISLKFTPYKTGLSVLKNSFHGPSSPDDGAFQYPGSNFEVRVFVASADASIATKMFDFSLYRERGNWLYSIGATEWSPVVPQYWSIQILPEESYGVSELNYSIEFSNLPEYASYKVRVIDK
jgi:hypothetical protein